MKFEIVKELDDEKFRRLAGVKCSTFDKMVLILKNNQQLSKERVLNENVIGCLKRFKITADCYRNRRKRFMLRFNLIAGIYNLELTK